MTLYVHTTTTIGMYPNDVSLAQSLCHLVWQPHTGKVSIITTLCVCDINFIYINFVYNYRYWSSMWDRRSKFMSKCPHSWKCLFSLLLVMSTIYKKVVMSQDIKSRVSFMVFYLHVVIKVI